MSYQSKTLEKESTFAGGSPSTESTEVSLSLTLEITQALSRSSISTKVFHFVSIEIRKFLLTNALKLCSIQSFIIIRLGRFRMSSLRRTG